MKNEIPRIKHPARHISTLKHPSTRISIYTYLTAHVELSKRMAVGRCRSELSGRIDLSNREIQEYGENPKFWFRFLDISDNRLRDNSRATLSVANRGLSRRQPILSCQSKCGIRIATNGAVVFHAALFGLFAAPFVLKRSIASG